MWVSFTESEFWVLENLSIWWRRNRLLRLDNCLNFTLQSPNSLFNLRLMCWSWAWFLHSQEWKQKKSWGPTLWNVAPESNISFNCHLYHEISYGKLQNCIPAPSEAEPSLPLAKLLSAWEYMEHINSWSTKVELSPKLSDLHSPLEATGSGVKLTKYKRIVGLTEDQTENHMTYDRYSWHELLLPTIQNPNSFTKLIMFRCTDVDHILTLRNS
jgi:hypothetical protein